MKSLLTWLTPRNKQQGQLDVIRESMGMVRGQQFDTRNKERTAFLSPSMLIMNISQSAEDLPLPLNTFWSLLCIVNYKRTPIEKTA